MDQKHDEPAGEPVQPAPRTPHNEAPHAKEPPREIGGPKGPEPTRYQDWEKGGRCVDF